MAEIGRLLTAMVTPFDDDGEINYKKARKLATALINSGSDGLVIGGTTGESPSMSNDEKIRLFAEVKEEVGEQAAVIAGTTDNNHRNSIELSKEAEGVGVDGLLLTVPAYNKPPMDGLYEHFKAIAAATSLPGILYNVPSRTSLNMDHATTLKLAEIDNIVGAKEASEVGILARNSVAEAGRASPIAKQPDILVRNIPRYAPPPNGLGAQLRGTGRHRPVRHPSSTPNSTRGRLKRAVPRQLQRLVERHGYFEPVPRGGCAMLSWSTMSQGRPELR